MRRVGRLPLVRAAARGGAWVSRERVLWTVCSACEQRPENETPVFTWPELLCCNLMQKEHKLINASKTHGLPPRPDWRGPRVDGAVAGESGTHLRVRISLQRQPRTPLQDIQCPDAAKGTDGVINDRSETRHEAWERKETEAWGHSFGPETQRTPEAVCK